MRRDSKTRLALVILVAGLFLVPAVDRSTDFPKGPITLVIPRGAEGATNTPMEIFGPKDMDPKVVKILQDAFHKAQSDPRFVSAMPKYGAPIMYMCSEECANYWTDAYVEAGDQVNKFIPGQ